MRWSSLAISVLAFSLAMTNPASGREPLAANTVSPSPILATVRAEDGTELLVAEAGDRTKPGILFIHGYAQSYLSFRRQFASDLARRYHLVAFDLRGHGGSTKPSDPAAYVDPMRWGNDVAAVMRATGLVRPVIVGWSYGGVVVGDYLRANGPANVAGVILAGTLGGFVKPSPPPTPTPDPMMATIKANSAHSRALGLDDNIAAAVATGAAYATPDMTLADRQVLFATELMLPAYVRRAMMKRPGDNSDLVASLASLPVLFVRGSGERGMPEPELATLRAQLPRSSLSRYQGAGHLAFFEQFNRFNAELAAFVDSTAAPTDLAAAIKRPGFPLPLAEHQRFHDLEFAATDTNGDRAIDISELRKRAVAAFGDAVTPERLARAMRINCGFETPACTRVNFRAQGDREFRRVDANGDGVVTQDEFRRVGSDFHLEKF